ncbi:MAG: glycosyltransferase family 2 protein [Candidatus Peregrinibacteria bacterium]
MTPDLLVGTLPLMANELRLSIVVPAYNEERTLPALIDRVQRSCAEDSEIIFVDDGSRDRTLEIMRAKARPQDTVLTKPNGGKGSAVHMGYARARGRYTIVQDADLEYSPEEIPLLLRFAEENCYIAVFGSRRLKRQRQYAHLSFFIGGSLLTFIGNFLYGTHLTDQPTCYKLVRTDVLRTIPLREKDFRFDPELTVMLTRRGVAIMEYPISYMPRSIHDGKKIGWRDWFRWVWVFIKLRFCPASALVRKD